MSSLLLIAPGSEGFYKASSFDQNIEGLNRAPFKKLKSHGFGSKHVQLELTGLTLYEYDGTKDAKLKHTEVLSAEHAEYEVEDGSEISAVPLTISLSKSVKSKSTKTKSAKTKYAKPIRTFYVAESAKTFEVWLRYLRRIIGANKVVSHNIDTGLHIQMWSDPACVTDIDGNIIDVNQPLCDLFGYDRSELIGQHNTIFMPRLVAAKHDSYMKRYEETGEKKVIGQARSVTAVTKSNKPIPIQLKIDTISANGSKQYVATMKDSTILVLNDDLSLVKKDADSINPDPVLSKVIDEVVQGLGTQLKTALSNASKTSALKTSYALNANRELEKQIKYLQSDLLAAKQDMARLEALNMIGMRALSMLITNTESDSTAAYNKFLQKVCATYPVETASLGTADFKLMQAILTDIDHEISKAEHDSLDIILREDDVHTQRIRSFMMMVGGSWLYDTLKDAVSYVMTDINNLDPDVFSDSAKPASRRFSIRKTSKGSKEGKDNTEPANSEPVKLEPANPEPTKSEPDQDSDSSDDAIKMVNSASKFVRRISRITKAIVENVDECPFMIRYIATYLKQKIDDAIICGKVGKVDTDEYMTRSVSDMVMFQDKSQNKSHRIVSGLLFLRFFVPAISQPSLFGLVPEDGMHDEHNEHVDKLEPDALPDTEQSKTEQIKTSPVLSSLKMSPKPSPKSSPKQERVDAEIETEAVKKAELKRLRVWGLLAKSMQNLVNGSSFQNRSNSVAIDVMNLFLTKNRPKIGLFIQAVLLDGTALTI